MKAQHDSLLARIRKEHGMSFKDAVLHYANMGMSRKATAKALQVSISQFRLYLRRFNLDDSFVPQSQMLSDCRGGWPKGTPRPPALHRRAPILHNGTLWYPGEPTYHFLYERKTRCASTAREPE